MTKKKSPFAKRLPGILLGMCFTLIIVGALWDTYRIPFIGSGFACLFLAYVLETVLSRGPGFDFARAKRSLEVIGTIRINDTSIICSDTVCSDLSRCETIENVPEGEYSVELEVHSSGAQKLIGLLRMTKGERPLKKRAANRVNVSVDTGILILACAQERENNEINGTQLEKTMLEILDEDLPVRLLRDQTGTGFGVIFAPWLGDDIYDVVVTRDDQGNCEVLINCQRSARPRQKRARR